MKRIFSIILCFVAVVSCRQASVSQESDMSFDDLLEEYLEVIGRTDFDGEAKSDFLNLAYDLYDVFHNSELNDISTRLNCQMLAGDLLMEALDFLQDDEDMFQQVFDKVNAVNYEWGVHETDETIIYTKEISYTVFKGTDHEVLDHFFILVEDGDQPKAYIEFPDNAALPSSVIFANRKMDSVEIDEESVVHLSYDSYLEPDPNYAILFDGNQFFDHLKQYDLAFINYINTDGDNESAVLALDYFHQQLKGKELSLK